MSSISERAPGPEVLERLRRTLNVDWRRYSALVAEKRGEGAFSVLVGVILSQNTNDRNSIKAFMNLKERVGVKLSDILEANVDDIAEAIKPAGLWKQKAEAIKAAAETINALGGEKFLLEEDPERLRDILLTVKGVGAKTVDVFLSVVRKAPFFAVDTHAMRIALRWGLSDKRSYDRVSRALLEYFGPENAEEAHRLIISLGRTYCTARSPRCPECPLTDICPSSLKH
ncbi:MAG: endonuclease III domain-containing protein [Acidilobaceae archaeon]